MQYINNYNLPELQDFIESYESDNFPLLNIVILRNITVEAITPYLQYFSLRMGFNADIKFGSYDNVLQDALDKEANLLNKDTDGVMVFTILDTLSPKLANSFTQLEPSEIEKEKDQVKNYIVTTLSGIRSKTSATINWHSFELPINPAFGIIDHTSSIMQTSTINELNEFLKYQLREVKNGYFIDINISRALIGAKQFYDNRYWHIGKAPYTLDALKEISIDNFKLFRALKGKNKKCLVLDCDNTLWGGIVGEDGINGIKLGPDYPGSTYLEFQQEILSLYHRGIILALCSKNNEQDVWDVMDNNQYMLIKREHISTATINWDDKASNIQKIASDLNIGLDSLVFIDDNEFEINLVKEMLPVVEIIHLPINKSATYKSLLASCGLFDNLSITNEDKNRSKLYKTEALRKESSRAFVGDINAYYESLLMNVCVNKADKISIPRIAQLTQKTNQFNLTSNRYSESDIQIFCENNDLDVIFVKLEDRFGNMGIVGCAIVKYYDDRAEIDEFLLSCRVIGRGLEIILLNTCIDLVRDRNIPKLVGLYIQTNKNDQVKEFYSKQGFCLVEQDGKGKKFTFKTKNKSMINPTYFKKINIRCLNE